MNQKSSESEYGVFPFIGRTEAQNDMLWRNSGLHQVFGNPIPRPVVLNPDFVAAQVNVNNTTVDTP
jgi:hypothetical protein